MRRGDENHAWGCATTIVAALLLAAPPLGGDLAGQGGREHPRGPYLGQTPPTTTPRVFAPGIVSTDAHEFACSFTPDGKEFYFTRRVSPRDPTLVMVSRLVGGSWTDPEAASFNAPAARMSFEPLVTPDGRRLYFSSDRPLPGQGGGGPPMLNIWYVERAGERWGEPKAAGAPFNPMQTMYVSMTGDGTIYTSDISGGMGSEQIAVARLVNGAYTKLERLGPPVNVGAGNMYPYISPDETYLVFTRRGPSPPATSLYVSFKNPDSTWGEPRAIDLGMPAGTPSVSPDGRYLFFSAGERQKGDIYWVSASVLRAITQ